MYSMIMRKNKEDFEKVDGILLQTNKCIHHNESKDESNEEEWRDYRNGSGV